MKQNARVSPRLVILIVLVLFLLNLSALAWIGWPALQERGLTLSGAAQRDPTQPEATPSLIASVNAAEAVDSPTPAPSATVPSILINQSDQSQSLQAQGVLLLSLRDGNYVHLFAYHPGLLPLTRLTTSDWDEIDPAVSPDGRKMAFTSRQNGYWDLFIRDLVSGEVKRITDTPEYDGRPSWSPDSQWLAYVSGGSDDLDIYLRSLTDPAQAPIRLTDDPSADTSPAWSPQGRQIAFVSNRSGRAQIWLADLDRTDAQREILLTRETLANDGFPVWSHDGHTLAWGSEAAGEHRLMVWDSLKPQLAPAWNGYGDRPAWLPGGQMLMSAVDTPNHAALQIYDLGTARERMPLMQLPGSLYGLSWAPGPLGGWLAEAIDRGDDQTDSVLVEPVLTLAPNAPSGRIGMVTLEDVNAPVPMLSDAVDEAYQALRLQAANESGWDILSSLENAYLPLTTPASPSVQDEWLYTGRAFALNPLILSAGWMAVTREDFGGQTYWRLFLKARFQDGSAGIPLERPTWDLNARFAGDTAAYEHGGQPGPVPDGYWIDLTELSRRYGWERLASRPNWRTFYPAIRFAQFVFRGGLDWNAAMAEVYPPEALATPTSVPTSTLTSTPTRAPTRVRTTSTPSPTPTPSATRRPTLTQQP